MRWSCTVHGAPVGKGRARTAPGHSRPYTPAKTVRWEGVAAQIFASQWLRAPLDCPVRLSVVAVVARPQRLMRAKDAAGRLPCTSKPDASNVLKAVEDALQDAGVLRDDSIIWDGSFRKVYAAKDEGPRVEVTVET